MARELQTFLVRGVQKAMEDLIGAVERLPADKRAWSPNGKARSAADQGAECAILNGVTAEVIRNRAFPAGFDFEGYEKDKAALAVDWGKVKELLEANTANVVSAIHDTPDEDLSTEIDMPWGKMSLAQIMSYPYWNMAYHEGQTTYIGFLLEE